MRAFVQTAKLGDIISVLPILQREAAIEGQPVPLVIGKEYASLLEGVSYVEPVIWKGDVSDLAGALLFAKKRFSRVVCLQTFGNIPCNHHTPSFQLDQWKRAGCLDKWEELPLTFDRRDEGREKLLLDEVKFCNVQPFILFADHSQSSPFLHKEELYNMLAIEFGPLYRIIRLSEVRSERIYDILGLMDMAHCLVTIETAHLHLSRASKVPVVALAANGWRGSAFSTRFKFFMRYAEWSESRKLDLLDAVRSAIGAKGARPDIKVTKMDTIEPHSYNLSRIEHDGIPHNCYRSHTNGDWKTKLFLNGNELHLPARYDNFSHEDLRLFVFKGKLHGAYVMSTTIDNQFRCYMAYGEINGNQIEHRQILHPENTLSGMTKNFVPFVHEGSLFFVYGIKGANQIVLAMDGNAVAVEYKTPAPTWGFGEIRGGCIIPHGDALLRFFHSRALYSDKTPRYFIGASIIEAKPPFKTLAVSKRPILQGDERYTPDCHHWKPNCALPYGCIKQGDKFLLSFGRNDCEACIAELTIDQLHL